MGNLTKLCTILIAASLTAALSACSSDRQDAPTELGYQATRPSAQLEPTSDTYTDYEPTVDRRLQMAHQEIINAYDDAGIASPTVAELDDVSVQICLDISTGGDGRFYHPSLVDNSEDQLLAQAFNYAFATATTCQLKSNFELGNFMKIELSEALNGTSFDFRAVLENRLKDLEDPLLTMNSDGTYDIDYSQLYLPGYQGEYSSRGGYPVACSDGSMSHSGGKQGACSWHGGLD